MALSFLNKYRDIGLLILRIGFGCMYIQYGAPKMFGGPKAWEGLGMAMGSMGITVAPVFWGFMASFSMFFGGICLIVGLLARPFSILLFITMAVAVSMHLHKGDGLPIASHAIDNTIVFLSLFFMGPGKYSLDEKL